MFGIGLVIGALAGMFVMSLMASANIADLMMENERLEKQLLEPKGE